MAHTQDFKNKAIARVESGETVAKVAEDIGVHYATLRTWCNDAGVEARLYKRFVPLRKTEDISKLVIRHECHITMTEPGLWECDRCGTSIYWDSVDKNDPPGCNFCPSCGAKVVD